LKIWDRAEQAIVGILGLAALACAVWQVLSRYFFPQQSIGYAEEVIVYLLIWATMIVSSQLVRTDSHVRPDVLRNIVPAAVARWLELFNCTAAIVFCGALTWYGWQIVATAQAIDEHSASDLRFPMWIYYAALPAGGTLMSIRYAIRLIGLAAFRDQGLLPRHSGSHERPDID
jgi:C4-dicarboxylate transporter, DctQ subunit